MKRILMASLVLTLAVAAVAAPPPGRGPRGDGGPQGSRGRAPGLPPQALAEFLDLSAAQVTEIQNLREQQKAAIQPLVEQRRENRQAIEAALDAGDTAKAGELLMAGKAIREQFKAAHDSFNASVEALLNAEQKEKWAVYQELASLRRRGPRD